MSLPSINFLHLTVSEIQPGQPFCRRPPAHPDTMGENNTPTALKGCGVKTIYWVILYTGFHPCYYGTVFTSSQFTSSQFTSLYSLCQHTRPILPLLGHPVQSLISTSMIYLRHITTTEVFWKMTNCTHLWQSLQSTTMHAGQQRTESDEAGF